MQKDRWAGMWECWFGGHVLSGQTYLDTAIAETREELGINVTSDDLKLFGKRSAKTSQENLYLSVYVIRKDLDIATIEYEKEEVELLEWVSVQELKTLYAKNNPEWVAYGYEYEMLDWLG